jgi:hypothetical protein
MGFIRTISMIAAVTVFTVKAGTVSQRYAVARGDSVAVYGHTENNAGEQPRTRVDSRTRLRIVGETVERYRVQVPGDVNGWVERSEVRVLAPSTSIGFDDAVVHGWLETPRVMVIFGSDAPPGGGIGAGTFVS